MKSKTIFLKLLTIIKNYIDDCNLFDPSFNSDSISDFLIENICNNDKKIQDPFIEKFQKNMFVMYSQEFKNFYFNNSINFDSEKILRLKKEFNIIKKSNSINSEASIFFWVEKNKLNKMRFIITGPKNTPYDQGLYIFDMTINNEFPTKPPLVQFLNHNGHRFNPNLYNCGKVCLSLLGTWKGDKGESWNSLTSTFFQIIVSIQSQILIEEPYFNEPGYEKFIDNEYGIIHSQKYNDTIRLYNLDYSINSLIKGVIEKSSQYPEFDELIKNYFIFKKDRILDILNIWENEYNDEQNKNKFIDSKNKFIKLVNEL